MKNNSRILIGFLFVALISVQTYAQSLRSSPSKGGIEKKFRLDLVQIKAFEAIYIRKLEEVGLYLGNKKVLENKNKGNQTLYASRARKGLFVLDDGSVPELIRFVTGAVSKTHWNFLVSSIPSWMHVLGWVSQTRTNANFRNKEANAVINPFLFGPISVKKNTTNFRIRCTTESNNSDEYHNARAFGRKYSVNSSSLTSQTSELTQLNVAPPKNNPANSSTAERDARRSSNDRIRDHRRSSRSIKGGNSKYGVESISDEVIGFSSDYSSSNFNRNRSRHTSRGRDSSSRDSSSRSDSYGNGYRHDGGKHEKKNDQKYRSFSSAHSYSSA